MIEPAAQFAERWPQEMARMRRMAPDIGKAFAPFFGALMRDGALSAKQKELVAVGIAVATHCEPCIHAHVEKCLTHGATPAEVMEAAGVAVVMGGGPAYTATPIVAAALEHHAARRSGTEADAASAG